ncbi:MAG: hypothetical protein IPO74_11525 [Thermomonas sp.]|nr:hypothetical protein [Thermomonas sp.]
MAILGLAAIAAAAAHQDNQHSNASNNSAQWDIGYNDGLHGVPYHNVARSDGYSGGCDAGVRQRNQDTSHHSGPRPCAGGAVRTWAAAASAPSSMSAVASPTWILSSGNTQYGIFCNRDTPSA